MSENQVIRTSLIAQLLLWSLLFALALSRAANSMTMF